MLGFLEIINLLEIFNFLLLTLGILTSQQLA